MAHEANGQWASAALIYADILSADRNDADAREHYQLCLRHVHQARRLRDASLRNDLLNRGLSSALNAYEEILGQVKKTYVEEKKATPSLLFQHGLQEFRFALEDKLFVETYLSGVKPEDIREFSEALSKYVDRDPSTLAEARALVREITYDAVKRLPLPEAVVVSEFAFGACNSLDEYTVALTPAQVKDLKALQSGKFVGIGVDLAIEDEHLLVGSVYPGSPAADQLKPRDQILSIDGKAVDHMTPEAAAARLHGAEDTKVELSISRGGETKTITLKRQAFAIRTVEDVHPLEGKPEVGYFRITGFGHGTREEIQDAVGQLKAKGVRALVVDLRGCGGGTFNVGVQCAGLFLSGGVIASSQSRLDQFNKTYESNNPDAIDMPIVVLVDGKTASAAELFAAALRDNETRHAVIVGRTNTFGKNTIQCFVPVNNLSGGMRVTVARFFPPSKQDFGGIGLVPDYVIDMPEDPTADAILQAAQHIAGDLIAALPSPPPLD
jgi:carboxyl-terminal processing protease